MPLTPEVLREALSEHPEVLVEALQGTNLQEVIDARVESALAEERKLAEAERDAVVSRRLELRDMRDEAHRLINEAKFLPESWRAGLCSRYQISEAHRPTADLDLVDEVDASGHTTKSAMTRLRESVEQAVKSERDKLAEVAPTRVRGQGPAKIEESEDGKDATARAAATQGETPYWKQILSEANVDPDKAYAAA